MTEYAFQRLPEGDVARQLLVDAVVIHGLRSTDSVLSSTMHPEFFASVGNTMFASHRAAEPKELDAKLYQLEETED